MSKKICVFGDSITWGAFDSEVGGWVERLKTHYFKHNPGLYLYNCGVSADKVGDVLKRVEVEVAARKPEKVIVAIGINDTPHYKNPQGTSPEIFRQEFHDLLEAVEQITKDVVLLGLTNVDEDVDTSYKNHEIKRYDEEVRKIAKENNLPFVELFGTLEKEDFSDGLHPNALGHKKIFEKVLGAL